MRVNKEGGAVMVTGTVKWWNTVRGYGYLISKASAEDVFVRRASLLGLDDLQEGAPVAFDLMVGDDGRKKAVNVVYLTS
jgi:CspA family cold shock protein